MKMTRRNFISTSAAALMACGVSLSAHAAGSEENGLPNFLSDILKDSDTDGTVKEATTRTAEKNAEWYGKLDFSDRNEFANAERGLLESSDGIVIRNEDDTTAWDLESLGDISGDAPDRSTRACGGIPSSTRRQVCSRFATASIRCAATIWQTRPSSAPTTAGSFSMSSCARKICRRPKL